MPERPSATECAADFVRLHGREAISSAKAALLSSETAEDLAYWAEVCAILATDDRYSFRPDKS